jgi:uncharacterized protein
MKSSAWLARVGLRTPPRLFAALAWAAGMAGCVRPTDRPLLWVIEGPRTSYLYGTIHVPDERVLALPPVVEKSLKSAAVFCAEAPLDDLKLSDLEPRTHLPKGQNLKDILSPQLYQRTDKYLRSKGLTLRSLSDRQIWFVAATLEMLDYVWDAAVRPPLDQRLNEIAKQAGKQLCGLETVAEQMAVFDSLTVPEQIEQLEETLAASEKAAREHTSTTRQLVAVYLRGDERELEDVLTASDQPRSPTSRALFARLITERNERMAQRIIEKVQAQPQRSYFFAIGAAHVVGDEGVVARLRRAGYEVRRVNEKATSQK